MDEARSVLQQLVRMPTVNPPGNDYAQVANFAGGFLAAAGYEVSYPASAPGLVNVLGLLRGTRGSPTLLLNGHLDVVPPGDGWLHPPFQAVCEDGRLYGRGSADMKGAVAAMMIAARDFARQRPRRPGNLLLAFTVDEETGGFQGVKYLLDRKLLRADWAVVGEPTDFEVRACQRGALWLEIEFQGRSAHGSLPHLGVNAIEMAAEAVSALRKSCPSGPAHALLGKPTLSVNLAEGGTKVNVIPNRCRLQLDRRLTPTEDAAAVEDQIRQAILATNFPGLSFDMTRMVWAEPFELSGERLQIADWCEMAYKSVAGRATRRTGELSFTDARLLVHQGGIPTVVFGPGLDSVCHITDEYIELEDVSRAAAVYLELAEQILG